MTNILKRGKKTEKKRKQ